MNGGLKSCTVTLFYRFPLALPFPLTLLGQLFLPGSLRSQPQLLATSYSLASTRKTSPHPSWIRPRRPSRPPCCHLTVPQTAAAAAPLQPLGSPVLAAASVYPGTTLGFIVSLGISQAPCRNLGQLHALSTNYLPPHREACTYTCARGTHAHL